MYRATLLSASDRLAQGERQTYPKQDAPKAVQERQVTAITMEWGITLAEIT